MITSMIRKNVNLKTGELVNTPIGFNLPVSLSDLKVYQIGDNYTSSIEPEDLIDIKSFPNKLYVDNQRGASGNGLSWATSVESIGDAVALAITSSVATRIFVRGGSYPRNQSIGGSGGTVRVLTADISIEAVYGKVETGPFDSLSWTLNGSFSNVWQTSRSSSVIALDLLTKDDNGNYPMLEKATSISDCNDKPASWFTDNATVYIHNRTSSQVNNLNTRVFLAARNATFEGNFSFYLSGLELQCGVSAALQPRNGIVNAVVSDCKFLYAVGGTFASPVTIDGVTSLDCDLFAAFNSECSLNSKDGFNFHTNTAQPPIALMVNSSGFGNGAILNTSQSNNGLTMHDGGTLIDIGGEWLSSIGTNSGHINDGTQAWCLGSIAGMSEGDEINGGGIDYGAFGMWDASGTNEMWLDGCTDIGSSIGIHAGTGTTIKIRNHNGVGIHEGNVINY